MHHAAPSLIRSLQNRVRSFAREEGLWKPGDRLVLAVSGGADSLCMLHLLSHLSVLDRLSLHVAHLHHGIRREEGEEDARFVAEQASALGLPFTRREADVPALSRDRRIGLEEAGRLARRTFLDRVRSEEGATAIATAHTRSDLAETVLMNLCRGAGLPGLSGITPRGFEHRIRPLLCLSREETEACCQAMGVSPRHDPANDDPACTRNRVRKAVVPLLRDTLNPSVEDVLARTAVLAAEAQQFLEQEAVQALAAARHSWRHYSTAPLLTSPPAVLNEALRHALVAERGNPAGVQYSEVDLLRSILDCGGSAHLGSGWRAQVSVGLLRFFAPGETILGGISGTERVLGLPAVIQLPEGPEFTLRPDPGAAARRKGRIFVELPMWVRPPHPGDRVRPVGRGGSRKLGDLFQERRVPSWLRERWPVILDTSGIVWIPGVALDERAACPAAGRVACVFSLSHAVEPWATSWLTGDERSEAE